MTIQITTVYPDGRSEVRDATPEEIAEMDALAADAALQQAEFEAEQQARLAARDSAIAKLAALGLTEEEAAAIVG